MGALGQQLSGNDEDWLLYVPAILGATFAAITAKARADFKAEEEYYDYLIEAAQQEREAKQQTLADYTIRLERRKAELASLEKRYKREAKIAREAKKQLAELEKEMQVIEVILVDLEDDIAHITQAIEEAEASQATELEDAQKRIAKLTEERDRLQDTLDAIMEIKGSQEELHATATRLSLLGNM
jgi:predicted  nucleic acid-binding Zn-ribbon protein